MTAPQSDSLQRQNPLLYWISILYVVGAPNFIHFDETGRTHLQGLFNATSLSAMFIVFLSTYVLLVIVVLARRPLLCREVHIAGWLWVVLLLQLVLATILQPVSRLTPPAFSDPFISFYRMYEWILGFTLFLALYTRTPAARATDLIVQLIGRASWIWIGITYTVLPVMPSHVYGGAGEGEAVAAHAQLGGELISPSYLATLSVAAFFYALFFFPRGLARVTGCTIAFITIVLTRTRIEQISFLLLLILYAVVFSGKFLLRLITFVSTAAVAVLGVLFRSTILEYVARGQSANSLATLNDRTRVWAASLQAIRARPILGYGFVVGAKNALRDYWIYTHWIPPHAHNEFLHALLSGGILALLAIVCIYGYALWTGFRSARYGLNQIYLTLLMVLFTFRSIGGSNITYIFTRIGAIFLLTYIGLTGEARLQSAMRSASKLKRKVITPRRAEVHEVGA